jgi:serine/threonine-protein kinase
MAESYNAKKLFNSLRKYWEPLFFIENDPDAASSEDLKKISFGIKLAFWLAKPFVLLEIIEELLKMEKLPPITLGNAFFALVELGSWKTAQQKLNSITPLLPVHPQCVPVYEMLSIVLQAHSESLDHAVATLLQKDSAHLTSGGGRVLLHLMELALESNQTNMIHLLLASIDKWQLSPEALLRVRCCQIWAFLLEKNWHAAGEILHTYPIEFLSQETSILHFLYGCWLYVTEGKEIAEIHFNSILDVPYPRTWTLFSHYIKGKVPEDQGWIKKAFLWEKRQLYKQLSLFYHCTGEEDKAKLFRELEKLEFIRAEE